MSDRCRLYLVTPSIDDPRSFAENLKAALAAGDVASVQLRLKGVADDDIRGTTIEIITLDDYEKAKLQRHEQPTHLDCEIDAFYM